jgi:hypothetical protein
MFNGLRKMVGGGTKGGSSDDDCRTPGGITPLIKSAKKRKAETPALAAFSAKRKYVLHLVLDFLCVVKLAQFLCHHFYLLDGSFNSGLECVCYRLEVLHSMPNGAMLSSTPAKSICLKPMPPDTPAQSLFYVTPPVNSVPK